MSEGPLKSAYELAMERLAQRDRDEGIESTGPLTDAQKARIAELRQEAQAKLAELEILHGKNRAAADDPEKLAKIDEEYEIDRRRVDSWIESAVARVRAGED